MFSSSELYKKWLAKTEHFINCCLKGFLLLLRLLLSQGFCLFYVTNLPILALLIG